MKIPFIRGIFSFVDSLVLGMKTLDVFGESFYEDEETDEKVMTAEEIRKQEKKDQIFMNLTVALFQLYLRLLFLWFFHIFSAIFCGIILPHIGYDDQ